MSAALSRPFRGIVPPLVTPLLDEERLDHAGLERVVDHVIAGGVHGIFLLGSTGEGPSLGYRLRRELIESMCEQVKQRVPVLVGITDTSFVEAVDMARWAAECEAQAVVIAPSPYFTSSQSDFVSYIENLTCKVSLPIFLYNMPSHTKVHLEPDTISRLMDLPTVVGLKDSSGNMIYFHRVLQMIQARSQDFTLFMGPEELMAEGVLFGAHGGVCGGSNLAPQLYVKLYEAAVRGDLGTVRKLQARVIELSNLLYTIGTPNTAYLRGLKSALGTVGLCSDYLAEPFHPFTAKERETLESRLEQLQLAEFGLSTVAR